MLQLVALIIYDVNQVETVAEAWTREGARGVTTVHTTGMAYTKDALCRDDVPLFPSLSDLLEHDDLQHRTIFTLTDDDGLVDRLAHVTQRLIGTLDASKTGLMFTLPVGRALGLTAKE